MLRNSLEVSFSRIIHRTYNIMTCVCVRVRVRNKRDECARLNFANSPKNLVPNGKNRSSYRRRRQ